MEPKNPICFPEGSVIRSVYSGKTYTITQHYKNGMCNLYNETFRTNENWNAYNNAHFVLVDSGMSLGVLSIMLCQVRKY